ncbi:cytochrome P450 [Aspergillus spinulosporus]
MPPFSIVSELLLTRLVYGLAGYVLWRLWRFTVHPLLNPNLPRELPYMIPFIGKGMRPPQTIRSTDSLRPRSFPATESARFTVDYHDAMKVLRDRPDIINTEHIKDLLHGLGCSKLGIMEIDSNQQCNNSVPDSKAALTNRPSLYEVAEELMKKQLLDRSLGNDLLARTLEVLETQGFPQASLMIMFRIPKQFARGVHTARTRVQRCLREFLRLPESEKSDQSWAIEGVVAEMRSRGMSEVDMASYLFVVFWAINANTFKIIFWLIAHIVSNPTILTAVTTEISSILADCPSNESLSSLSIRLERNTLLEALHNEAQRLALSTSSARTIQQDVNINGRTFKARAQVVVPYRHLAMCHPLLSQEWDVFQPERFLSNPGLGRNKSFLPFGGGKHKCMGRFLSRRLVLTFISLFLHRFTVRPLDEIPKMGFRPVSSGPAAPMGEMRLVISQKEY